MNSFNTSVWSNDSSLRNNSNDDFNVGAQYRNNETIHNIALFLICLLGLPANLLVITVYLGKMTTSTRVYMLALAVADLAICACEIVQNATTIHSGTLLALDTIDDLVIAFSVILLAFVSSERLLAVMRPHAFSLNARRAKKALFFIFVSASAYTFVVFLADRFDYTLFQSYFRLSVLLSCAGTMIICYMMIAAKLLKKTNANRSRVACLTESCATKPGRDNMFTKVVVNPAVYNEARPLGQVSSAVSTNAADAVLWTENTEHPTDPGPSTGPTKGNTVLVVHDRTWRSSADRRRSFVSRHVVNVANQAKTYKKIMLLFIITVVFVACWVPQALEDIGVSVAEGVRRLFKLNSVLNPFIYCLASAMFREDVRSFYQRTRARLSH